MRSIALDVMAFLINNTHLDSGKYCCVLTLAMFFRAHESGLRLSCSAA